VLKTFLNLKIGDPLTTKSKRALMKERRFKLPRLIPPLFLIKRLPDQLMDDKLDQDQ
jgi:hypothetical protein